MTEQAAPINQSFDPQGDFFAQVARDLAAKQTPAETPATTEAPAASEKAPEPPTADNKAPEAPPAPPAQPAAPVEAKEDSFDEKEIEKQLFGEPSPNVNQPEQNLPPTQDIESYKQKLAEYEALLGDKEIDFVVKAKKDGKSVFEAVKEIQGEDHSKLSDKELFEKDLKNFNLSEDEYAQHLDKFNGMLPQEQKAIVGNIRAALDAKRNAQLEQYTSTSAAKKAQQEEIMKSAYQKASVRVNELKGQKDFMNLEITAERWSKIEERIGQMTLGENNQYDVDSAYQHAVWDLYGKDLIMANVRKAKTKGRVEVLDEVNRPSMGAASPTTMPPVTDGNDSMKKSNDAFFAQQAQNY